MRNNNEMNILIHQKKSSKKSTSRKSSRVKKRKKSKRRKTKKSKRPKTKKRKTITARQSKSKKRKRNHINSELPEQHNHSPAVTINPVVETFTPIDMKTG